MAPDSKVKAGIYGNLGALLIGAQGRLEDALECTEQATALGIEASMQESQLFAGHALGNHHALHASSCQCLTGLYLSKRACDLPY